MAEAVTAPVNTAVVPRGPDILVRTAPPLSATSDLPLAAVPKPPASASNDAADQASGVPTEMTPQAQAAARTAKTDPGPSEEAEVDTATQAPVDPTLDEIETIQVDGKDVPLPPWMKREITKARNRQRDAEAVARTAADELAAIKASVEDLKAKVEQPKPTETAPPAEDQRPTRDKFDDPDAYDEALTNWAQREGERKAAAKLEQTRVEAEAAADKTRAEAQQAAREAEVTRIKAEWETKKEAAAEKYPDFEAVTTSDDLQITPHMAYRITTKIPNGTDVAYFLGKNPDEAARIAVLPADDQAQEIALISARLATPAPRTRARPLEPLGNGNTPADSSMREPSMEEWGNRRTKEILGGRRPFMEPASVTPMRRQA